MSEFLLPGAATLVLHLAAVEVHQEL